MASANGTRKIHTKWKRNRSIRPFLPPGGGELPPSRGSETEADFAGETRGSAAALPFDEGRDSVLAARLAAIDGTLGD
jgi:hypothetical protein